MNTNYLVTLISKPQDEADAVFKRDFMEAWAEMPTPGTFCNFASGEDDFGMYLMGGEL